MKIDAKVILKTVGESDPHIDSRIQNYCVNSKFCVSGQDGSRYVIRYAQGKVVITNVNNALFQLVLSKDDKSYLKPLEGPKDYLLPVEIKQFEQDFLHYHIIYSLDGIEEKDLKIWIIEKY